MHSIITSKFVRTHLRSFNFQQYIPSYDLKYMLLYFACLQLLFRSRRMIGHLLSSNDLKYIPLYFACLQLFFRSTSKVVSIHPMIWNICYSLSLAYSFSFALQVRSFLVILRSEIYVIVFRLLSNNR